MKVTKLARQMEAWRLTDGAPNIPDEVLQWITFVPRAERFCLISPVTGHSCLLDFGDWIVRAETGCLYAVTDRDFGRKYAPHAEELL